MSYTQGLSQCMGMSLHSKTLAGCSCVGIKAPAWQLPTVLLDLLSTGILSCMETKYQGSVKKCVIIKVIWLRNVKLFCECFCSIYLLLAKAK